MKTKNSKKKKGKAKSIDMEFNYDAIVDGGFVFLTFVIVFLDGIVILFIEFFPAFSTALALMAINGENIKDWFIILYSIYLLFFIFQKYKKYGNGNGKGNK